MILLKHVKHLSNKRKHEEFMDRTVPACFRSWGVPDLARTSRSTRLRDMRPKVSPDINPAKTTRRTIIIILMKNSVSQHLYSTAIEN